MISKVDPGPAFYFQSDLLLARFTEGLQTAAIYFQCDLLLERSTFMQCFAEGCVGVVWGLRCGCGLGFYILSYFQIPQNFIFLQIFIFYSICIIS